MSGNLLPCGLQGSNPQPELRLMDWIWLWAGECNHCRQAHWMTQTWEYFCCWILCMFWLPMLVKFTWWVKSVCHFLLWWNASWHYECWLSLCSDDGACSSSLGRGGGYRLTFWITKDLPFDRGPLFLSSFFCGVLTNMDLWPLKT